MKTAEEIFLENGCQHFTERIQRAMVINAMNEFSQQEREKAVREFKDRLINEISEGNSIDTSYVYYAELVGLIENTK